MEQGTASGPGEGGSCQGGESPAALWSPGDRKQQRPQERKQQRTSKTPAKNQVEQHRGVAWDLLGVETWVHLEREGVCERWDSPCALSGYRHEVPVWT